MQVLFEVTDDPTTDNGDILDLQTLVGKTITKVEDAGDIYILLTVE